MTRIGCLAGIVVLVVLALGAPAQPAGRFSANVTNPWFPLRPGTVFVYTGVKDGRPARDVLKVTHATKAIAGARCRVLDDRLYVSGQSGRAYDRLVHPGFQGQCLVLR